MNKEQALHTAQALRRALDEEGRIPNIKARICIMARIMELVRDYDFSYSEVRS